MASNRILLRNTIRDLVATLPGFNADKVKLYKLDRVDETPFASVYLDRMDSDLETMTSMGRVNAVSRKIRVAVDFHLDEGTTDADSAMDDWVAELEQKVMKEARADNIGDIRFVVLTSAVFRPLSTHKEKRGDLVAIFEAEYEEMISSQ